MNTTDLNSWEGVRSELLRRINTRIWHPGEVIPTEEKLAAEFKCSRATVNRAMRDLAEAGLIERKRKAGTRVTATPVRKATLDIPITRLEVEGRGQRHSFALLETATGPAPGYISSRFGLDCPVQLLHLRTLHFADSRPFLYEDRWLNPEVVPEAVDADFSSISVNEWLVRNIPYTSGDIAFSAANASTAESEYLDTAPGTALFVIDRTTWNPAGVITIVRLAYAPGHRMHTTL